MPSSWNGPRAVADAIVRYAGSLPNKENRNMSRLCLILALCLSAFAADRPPKTRLAEVEDIRPASYKADLTLDPVKYTYSGSVSIRMQVNKPVETIWLN